MENLMRLKSKRQYYKKNVSCHFWISKDDPMTGDAQIKSIEMDGHVLASCQVVDISDAGAGLDLDEHVILPDRFWLSLVSENDERQRWQVELRWRRGRSAGVVFV